MGTEDNTKQNAMEKSLNDEFNIINTKISGKVPMRNIYTMMEYTNLNYTTCLYYNGMHVESKVLI